MKKLPDFLVVGAMKSGTTTLKDYLRMHDRVYMPDNEIHFFNDDERYFEGGLHWYRLKFEDARFGQIIGEKTPTYSYLPIVPERIHASFPDVKLIWVFREPVARAYSNYWHAVVRGVENLSFEEVTRRENEIISENFWRGYLKRSRYIEQVERFLSFFSKSQMHFLLFEEMIASPGQALRPLFEFLGVEPLDDLDQKTKKSNVSTHLPRSFALERMARGLFGDTIFSRLYNIVHRLNQQPVDGYPTLDEDYAEELKAHFEPYNRRLDELIDLDLGVWQK